MIGFADQLHVSVLNAVVNHLDVVPSSVLAHPIAARRTIGNFSGNSLENLFDKGPCGWIAAWHDGRAMARAFLAAGNAGADEQDAFGGQILGAAIGVGVERIAAVDDDVARFEKR